MGDVLAEVVTETAIQDRVAELGAAVTADFAGREPVVVGVLHGSLFFLTDLVRHLPPSIETDFLLLTRFGEEGRVSIAMDTSIPLQGRHVILVEDLIDTGLTVATLRRVFEARGVASLTVIALLDKAARRIVDTPIEYRGFEVGDEFLLGYGLDWEGWYRNLRSLWAVLDLAAFTRDPAILAREVFPGAG
jgi:hypoxanthine phosphoribosyltransferase